jgi:hypothetical protein
MQMLAPSLLEIQKTTNEFVLNYLTDVNFLKERLLSRRGLGKRARDSGAAEKSLPLRC